MALSKIDVANMLTGATPVANGGTALTSGFVNGGISVADHYYLASSTTAGTAGIVADSGGAGGGAWTKHIFLNIQIQLL